MSAIGRLIDAEPHFDRFDHSLGELAHHARPWARAALRLVLRELLARNDVENGLLYFQATRGVAPRDHKFPAQTQDHLVATAKRLALAPGMLEQGCVGHHHSGHPLAALRYQVPVPAAQCAGQAAGGEAGAYEAWQVDDNGNITEGTSTNAWIVTAAGRLVTRPLGAGDPGRRRPPLFGRHPRRDEAEIRAAALRPGGAARGEGSLPHQQQRIPAARDAARWRPGRRRQRRPARPRAAPAHGCRGRATKRRMIEATPAYDLKEGRAASDVRARCCSIGTIPSSIIGTSSRMP